MKAFKFTLQALLTLREKQERKALQEYGGMLNAQERAVSNLDSARAQLEEVRAQLQEQILRDCSANQLWQWQCSCSSLERRIVELKHAADVARGNARLAFTRLLAARHATAIIQKLQEKQQRGTSRAPHPMKRKMLQSLEQQRRYLMMMLALPSDRPAHWN